jgi:hypothetical protein
MRDANIIHRTSRGREQQGGWKGERYLEDAPAGKREEGGGEEREREEEKRRGQKSRMCT